MTSCPRPSSAASSGRANRPSVAIELYAAWLEGTLPDGTDEWAIGRERHDAMVALRAFDGLDADAILELGWSACARSTRPRGPRPPARSTPTATRPSVVERVKSDQPATFEAALDAYRDAMLRARAHLIEHDLVTVPDDERIDVIETPAYLRNVVPFAAYFEPAAFDREAEGHLHRHAVGRRRPERDARAQLRLDQQHQHPRGLPGPPPPARHGPPATVAHPAPDRRARVRRGLGDVLGADDARARASTTTRASGVVMHTDAIWRACRIILDVRMHRGELSVDEATDFLVEHTRFERPNAAGRGPVVHLPPDLSALVPARADAAARAARRRAAPAGRPVQPQGLPRHAVAQRVAADQLPSPAARRPRA